MTLTPKQSGLSSPWMEKCAQSASRKRLIERKLLLWAFLSAHYRSINDTKAKVRR